MQRIPTTPSVGVEERRPRVGQDRPSGESEQPESEKYLNGPIEHSSKEHNAPGSETPTARKPGSGPDHVTSVLLSDKDVGEYQRLHKVRFGKDITYKEAHEQGVNLVRLLELIYTPMTLDEYQRLQQHRRDARHS